MSKVIRSYTADPMTGRPIGDVQEREVFVPPLGVVDEAEPVGVPEFDPQTEQAPAEVVTDSGGEPVPDDGPAPDPEVHQDTPVGPDHPLEPVPDDDVDGGHDDGGEDDHPTTGEPDEGWQEDPEYVAAADFTGAQLIDGAIPVVLRRVGYDADRAKAAITAEHDRGTQRSTLLAQLHERTTV